MATPRRLPFEVRLHFNQRGNPFTRPLRNFTDDPAEAEIDETFLVEYSPCAVEFTALEDAPPDNARLYIDGFDALVDSDSLLADDDRVYVPCGTMIQIQGYEPDEAGPGRSERPMIYPWIPGNYRVEVTWGDRSYHTILHVRPKDLDYSQLQLMRDELERYVVGLTLDLIRKNQGIGRSDIATELPVRFYQYQVLEKYFHQIRSALLDIVRQPKQVVRRVHEVVPFHANLRRDDRSYRWMHSAAGHARNGGHARWEPRFALAPESSVHYDIPENRWIKRIVEDLIAVIDEIARVIEDMPTGSDADAYREQEKLRRVKEVRRLQPLLRAVLSAPVLKEVKSERGWLPYTPAMQRDGRYRTVYRFWRDLQSHSEVRVDASFEYQWKRTDVLWEYWTFVRTIEALKELGFEPVSGWIYDERWRFPERVFIPVIAEGTRVVMARGEETVEVHYAARLPTFRDEAKATGSFLYVDGTDHNCPDIRLDYYSDGEYRYSVVVEAKYRKKHHIWDETVARRRTRWTKIMNQLQAYRTGIGPVHDKSRRTVEEVIALYPGHKDDRDSQPVYQATDDITLIKLVPGQSNREYVERLARYWGEPQRGQTDGTAPAAPAGAAPPPR